MQYDFDAIKDFDKSILLSPNDCNSYFARSLSKSQILDIEGQILDLEKAIELSLTDNELNREYKDEFQRQGFKNGATDFFQIRLRMAKNDLQFEFESKMKIDNASSIETKDFLQKLYDERREKKIGRIKRR